MAKGSGGGGRPGRSGGGGSTNGDAGQPGEVVREANKANDMERVKSVLAKNTQEYKTLMAGNRNLNAAMEKIESEGFTNFGQKNFQVYNALNEAAIKSGRKQSILRRKEKNIMNRYNLK